MRAAGAQRNNSQTAEIYEQVDPKFIETLMPSEESVAWELPAPLKSVPLQISSIKVRHVAAWIISVLELLKWAGNDDLFCTKGHLRHHHADTSLAVCSITLWQTNFKNSKRYLEKKKLSVRFILLIFSCVSCIKYKWPWGCCETWKQCVSEFQEHCFYLCVFPVMAVTVNWDESDCMTYLLKCNSNKHI